ncbi:NAD(P)H-hydrate dehydratase [bacterium]|nr:NAD(P)H-hydrate dehydratase [bacterium]
MTQSKNDLLLGEPVVRAADMAAFEGALIAKDPCLSEKFMDIAALGLMKIFENKILEEFSPDRVVLLIGKGNNGGDAFALGSLLLQSGYEVVAYQFFPETSPLSEKKGEFYERQGGERIFCNAEEIDIGPHDLVVDGLLGTGFSGKVKGEFERVIHRCNALSPYTYSIDIPSGVDGNTGKVEGIAIQATLTAYLGALKVGHLFEEGYEHVGMLHYVDFGMDIEGISSYAYLPSEGFLRTLFPKRGRCVHKYLVGEVSVFGGTNEMSGATNLACLSAYRTGVGLVRHFYLEGVPCNVVEAISKKVELEALTDDTMKSRALLIGPGLGRSASAKKLVEILCKSSTHAMVIDADALALLDTPPKGAILTPHQGELRALLGVEKMASMETLLESAQKYCDKHEVIIICKGMPTIILSPKREKYVQVSGNPGMATGGSGDVLSGILVALVGMGMEPHSAALLGVYLHGMAGDLAGENLSMASLMASDIIASLPAVLASL